MGILLLLLGISVAALVVRAAQSKDERWMRGLGLGAAAITAGLMPIGALLDWQPSAAGGLALLSAAPIYLIIWATISKDAELHRMVSLAAALPGAFAVFILYMSTSHYSE